MIPAALGGGVVVRPFEPGDAGELAAAIDRDRARLRRWLSWVDSSRTESDAAEFCDRAADAAYRGIGLHCGVFAGAAVVGGVGAEIDAVDLAAEIGYWVAGSRAGTGLATRAVAALVDHLIVGEELRRVTIEAATGNTASRALALRLGFRHEGTLREAGLVGGRAFDHEVYGILAHEWARGSAQAPSDPKRRSQT